MGHSVGGALALYALLEGGGLIHRVIATSPAADEHGVQLLNPDACKGGASVCRQTSSPQSGHEIWDTGRVSSGCPNQLSGRRYADLRCETAMIPDCGHIGASTFGYLTGLR